MTGEGGAYARNTWNKRLRELGDERFRMALAEMACAQNRGVRLRKGKTWGGYFNGCLADKLSH